MAEVQEMVRPRADGPQAAAAARTKLAERESRRLERSVSKASRLAMRARSPFAVIRRFAEEMDRLIEDLGMDAGPYMPGMLGRGPDALDRQAGVVPIAWSPQVEILERDGRLVVRVDLPGLSKDDVRVDLTDEVILIQGERKRESMGEGEGYTYSDRCYGTFYRAISIPGDADASKATAEFRDGVLEVAIPVPPRPEARPRHIEIREAK